MKVIRANDRVVIELEHQQELLALRWIIPNAWFEQDIRNIISRRMKETGHTDYSVAVAFQAMEALHAALNEVTLPGKRNTPDETADDYLDGSQMVRLLVVDPVQHLNS